MKVAINKLFDSCLVRFDLVFKINKILYKNVCFITLGTVCLNCAFIVGNSYKIYGSGINS